MKRLICVILLIFGVAYANAIEPLVTDLYWTDEETMLELRYKWIFDIDNNRIIKQCAGSDIRQELIVTKYYPVSSDKRCAVYVFQCDYEHTSLRLYVGIPTDTGNMIMVSEKALTDGQPVSERVKTYSTSPKILGQRDNMSKAAYKAFVEQFVKDISEAVQSKQSAKSKSKPHK